MQSWLMLYSQTANSPMMEQIIFVLDHGSTICVSIIMITFLSMTMIILNKMGDRMPFESNDLEIFWILLPTAMLYFMGSPSLKLLEMTESHGGPAITFKAIGHQWYWSYEYASLKSMEYDSYMENNSKMRLLMTNNHLILPSKEKIRALVTSEDVIHSWAMPSLGVKMDCVPGRLNMTEFLIKRSGIMTGQCSELCGAGHSFMPITLSAIPANEFNKSILEMMKNM